MTTRWCYVKSSRQKPINSEQHKRFIETARELECDEDKGRFEEKLKQIVTSPNSKRQAGSGEPSTGGKPRRARSRPGKE
jgi:hypothetical protein